VLGHELRRLGIARDRTITRAQHDAFELPHVARPLERGRKEEPACSDRESKRAALRFAAQRALGERGNVLAPSAQRRQIDEGASEPMIEVLAEASVFHRSAQVAVGRTDDSHLRALRLGAVVPERAVGAELREVEEELLRMRRKIEELVEDQRASVGELDEPDTLSGGPGERSALVTEELRRDRIQIVAPAERRAHDRTATARIRDGLREQRLAGARLAEDQDREIRTQRRRDLFANAAHAVEREKVVERDGAPRVGHVRERFAEACAILVASRALVDERADDERGGHEELDVRAFDVFSRIAYVDVEHGARAVCVRARPMERRGHRGEDPQRLHARRRFDGRHVPRRALARFERALDERLADLFALERAKRLAFAARVDRSRRARAVRDEHEPAVRTEDLDDDVERVVEHRVSIQDAEHALDEGFHRAPHRVCVETRARGEGIGHDPPKIR
jgi:hypothetical protein